MLYESLDNEWSDSERPDPEWWKFVADPSRLPTEVWEHILDECDVSDWDETHSRMQTFAACCLTCRAWLPRSRYHLFKYVTVQSKEQVKQVSKLLHSIPALRTRVEDLHVDGSEDGKTDASWIGLVGFHLGPKLKALARIFIHDVDFSLMKSEAYIFWGAFNRSWRPDGARMLYLNSCTVTHPNQPIRLAVATKAKSLTTSQNKQAKSGLPAPVLPSGISLPLSDCRLELSPPDLMLSVPWHTLTNQCPTLSHAEITCSDENLDLSSPDGQLFLVSILCMFHRMQRHHDNSRVVLWTDSLPSIGMLTRLRGKSANADNTLIPQSRLRRELDLSNFRNPEPSQAIGQFTKALTLLEDAMVLANYTDKRFHQIRIFGTPGIRDLQPDSFESLDGVLSCLLVATHDVHVIIEERRRPYEGCIAPWARERFPMLTAVVPNAFCDPEAGRPCKSHPKQANGGEQGQEVEGRTARGVTALEQDVGMGPGSATGEHRATEQLEAEGGEARGECCVVG